jgi:DNA helicase HerA-like ATPase
MSLSPLEFAESLHIGTVEFVSPNEIKVALDIEAPESMALNTGTPRPFPRVNGYVLIPNDDGFLVGQVEWLTIEPSAYPKRRGMMDFGLVDLPYPMRKLKLNPLRTLRIDRDDIGKESYDFSRGVESFPSVGDSVLMPTQAQLRAIAESGKNRRVKIGTSVLAGNADICIDPDRLFGRHLAVLGNTGSGKSCSVAGLIRWSLEASARSCSGNPNARFVILDPNGEYSRAFSEETGVLSPRIFKIEPDPDIRQSQLQVPIWFWNSEEWSSFVQASDRTQKPLLKRALRDVRAGRQGVTEGGPDKIKLSLRRYLSSKMITTRRDLKNGSIQNEETKFGFRLVAMQDDLQRRSEGFPEFSGFFSEINNNIANAINSTQKSFTDKKNGKVVEYFQAFTEDSIEKILASFGTLLEELGGILYEEGPSEDMPINFSGTDLCDHLSILSEEENVSQYLDFLTMRIRTLLSDTRLKPIIGNNDTITLDKWLIDYIGENQAQNGCLTIIDLSLVPSEIVHIITAVIARMIFESLQRYRRDNHTVLPTVLVMEEAHTFVRRYKDDTEFQDAAAICCKVFERIAREGRKFGLGLVLSSQRPSELSPTVLSQCNSFLLHRISNDNDQDLVYRYVPDNLRGLLRDLPILPSQNAILLGWASELPVIVRMNDLPKSQQPQSDDPDFWKVWTGEVKRDVDWKSIADTWQGK